MKYLKIIIIAILFISLSSCEKEDDEKYFYEETKCADPWGYYGGLSDNELIEKINQYLIDSLQIEFSNLQITDEGEYEFCEACICKTGRFIRIDSDDDYEDELLGIGFIREN